MMIGSLFIAIIIGGAYMQITLKNIEKSATKQEESGISAADLSVTKSDTINFFNHFKEGKKLNETDFSVITLNYFNNDFIENTFPTEKSKLFGIYGYEKLTHSYSVGNGIEQEGAIKSLEISGVQKDNVNKTITVYVQMDALEKNTTHWIEWRDIPGEGWKINTVSFDGNIKDLAAPLSPKKEY